MKEIEDVVSAGDLLPTIASVAKANGPFSLMVAWSKGSREGRTDVIDVAPQVFTYKVYRPLRDDDDLFSQVSVSDDRTADVWPGNADLEISADALEELAE
ncbi:hypothetical protein [Beijerinckia sp. L45]|uniref:hypothetical protein n=1 Tax=Beijerinckia sp. L45 TaxID=1641855 RepID=UPI001FEFAF3E|nr:hypothetical protein [Beijerinckia sp. L45]